MRTSSHRGFADHPLRRSGCRPRQTRHRTGMRACIDRSPDGGSERESANFCDPHAGLGKFEPMRLVLCLLLVASSARAERYVVQPGETLETVADAFGCTTDDV